jgi:hypothetical protein
MSLSLIDLAAIIELVEEKLHEYKFERDNPENSDTTQSDYAELLVQLGITADNLQDEYEEQYVEGTSRPTYEELIQGIRARLEKSA